MRPPLEIILQILLKLSLLRAVVTSDCSSPLGMWSRDIQDDQISASSYRDGNEPKHARLNTDGEWRADITNRYQWLQVDLLKTTMFTGIQTQGRRAGNRDRYVKSFQVSYSYDDNEADWIMFTGTADENQLFEGNSDVNSVQTNTFNPPIIARYIRAHPRSWNGCGQRRCITMRIELLGCEFSMTTAQTTVSTKTALSTSNAATTDEITTVMTTKQQTTRSTLVTTYSMSSTRSTTVTMEGITSAGPQRSTSSAISRPGTPSPASNNTSGISDGLAGNQAGSVSGAIIGGAVAAGVVLVIAIIVSIFFIRRRRSKPKDEKEPSSQADEGTVDNIYYGGVAFAANGNASTNGHVSIGQSEGMVDNNLYAYAGTTNGHASTIDQSEGMVDNHLYAGTTKGNDVPMDQSEGTVDNHLYAGTGDAYLDTRKCGDEGAHENVYYNVAHTSDEGVVENDIYC